MRIHTVPVVYVCIDVYIYYYMYIDFIQILLFMYICNLDVWGHDHAYEKLQNLQFFGFLTAWCGKTRPGTSKRSLCVSAPRTIMRQA